MFLALKNLFNRKRKELVKPIIVVTLVSETGISYRVGLVKDIPYKEITYRKVCRFGKSCGYKLLPVEIGSLLRKEISDEEMKAAGILWVGCMSKTIEDLYSYHKYILGFGRGSRFGRVEAFFLSDIGSIPLVFRQGGAFAFLMPNPNKG